MCPESFFELEKIILATIFKLFCSFLLSFSIISSNFAEVSSIFPLALRIFNVFLIYQIKMILPESPIGFAWFLKNLPQFCWFHENPLDFARVFKNESIHFSKCAKKCIYNFHQKTYMILCFVQTNFCFIYGNSLASKASSNYSINNNLRCLRTSQFNFSLRSPLHIDFHTLNCAQNDNRCRFALSKFMFDMTAWFRWFEKKLHF